MLSLRSLRDKEGRKVVFHLFRAEPKDEAVGQNGEPRHKMKDLDPTVPHKNSDKGTDKQEWRWKDIDSPDVE